MSNVNETQVVDLHDRSARSTVRISELPSGWYLDPFINLLYSDDSEPPTELAISPDGKIDFAQGSTNSDNS